MTSYHLTPAGPKPCTASKRTCPLGGPAEHFQKLGEAEATYAARVAGEHSLFPALSGGGVTSTLLASPGARAYPEAVLRQLGGFLESRPTAPLAVVPGGSDLYNTKLPGRAVHDYDFTVFTTPSGGKKKIHQHLAGELDVTTVEVTSASQVMRRSAPMSEAFFALQAGRALATFQDSPWSAYAHGLRYPVEKYFDLLDDVLKSHSDIFQEPVRREDAGFKDFKHVVRWHLYRKRWGRGGSGPFDPRLSGEEREEWLSVLEEGSLRRFRQDS